jgi:hypothetical protein
MRPPAAVRIELTFFRFALKPPAPPEAGANGADVPGAEAPGKQFDTSESASNLRQSSWRARQIYMAHFAVSDLDRREFHFSERFARDALGLAGAQADPFRVSLDDWSLGVPANAAANTTDWRLIAADKGYSLDLQLTPASPIMFNGDAGLSRKSDAKAPQATTTRSPEWPRRAASCAMGSRSTCRAPSGSTASGAAARSAPNNEAGTGSPCNSRTAARSCSTRYAIVTEGAMRTVPAPGSLQRAACATWPAATCRST